nr:VP7 [Wongorr virus]UBB38845.1 VP7 [Wongorr virus]UBB38848.1 VP7 [Wongorr virus]
MESARARALSLLEAISTLSNPRNRRDSTTINGLVLFTARYNATGERVMTITPSTQEEHTNTFLAALDIACAVLNVNLAGIYQGYVPNTQVIAILAREELPFTNDDFRVIQRIDNEVENGTNTMRFSDPYDDAEEFVPPGVFFKVGREHFAYCDARTLSVALERAERVDASRAVRPNFPDVTQFVFSWAPYRYMIRQAGAVAQGSRNISVTRDGMNVLPGRQTFATPRTDIFIQNNDMLNDGLVAVTIHSFTRARASFDVYPGYRSDCAAVYTYQDAEWHALRSRVCADKGLPETHMPHLPPNDPESIFTLAVLSRLYDCYACHRPTLRPVLPAPGGPGVRNRAILDMAAL